MVLMIEEPSLIVDVVDNGMVGNRWSSTYKRINPFPCFYYVVGGQGGIETRGKVWHLKKGCCYLPDSIHTLQLIDSPTLNIYWIHFRSELMPGLDLFHFYDCPFELKIPQKLAFFEEMQRHFPPQTIVDQLKLQAMVRLLLIEFLRFAEPLLPGPLDSVKRFQPVFNYIAANIARDISLEDLAALCQLNPNYFSTLFSREIGISPMAYLWRYRIRQAQMMLWDSVFSVEQIAAKVGYADPCYFCRLFKKSTGTTPSSYRRQRARYLI